MSAAGIVEVANLRKFYPIRQGVIPRVVGAAISVALLAVFFDAVTLLGGSLVATAMDKVSFGEYMASLRLALTPLDISLTIAKGAIFGAGIYNWSRRRGCASFGPC